MHSNFQKLKCRQRALIELTRLNELTVKRKTAITLIRNYHANLFFCFLFIVLHRASGRKEEEGSFLGLWFGEKVLWILGVTNRDICRI